MLMQKNKVEVHVGYCMCGLSWDRRQTRQLPDMAAMHHFGHVASHEAACLPLIQTALLIIRKEGCRACYSQKWLIG